MSKSNRTADDRPRDGKRASRGAKSKSATIARRQQRDAKRRMRGER